MNLYLTTIKHYKIYCPTGGDQRCKNIGWVREGNARCIHCRTTTPLCLHQSKPVPFAVTKKVQLANICPLPATTAVLAVNPVLAVNNASTVSSATSVQSITTLDATSTSKRQNSTAWLNPPPKMAKIVSTSIPYTAKEDNLILKFASKNLDTVGGKTVWKVLHDGGVIPNRTYESLRSSYLRHLKKQ